MNTEAFDPEQVPIVPAATVIPLRDGDDGLEVLVLRRDTNLAFHGGSWVFPGGRLDEADWTAGPDEEETAARVAAAREANEEAGLVIDPSTLVPVSHWTTPLGRNRRFATYFYVTDATGADVVVDDGEIREFEWHPIQAAIDGCDRGEIQLAGPTYVCMLSLVQHTSVTDALAAAAAAPYETYLPRIIKDGDTTCSVYPADPAYESGDLSAPGTKHRMHMLEKGYRYIDERGEAN